MVARPGPPWVDMKTTSKLANAEMMVMVTQTPISDFRPGKVTDRNCCDRLGAVQVGCLVQGGVDLADPGHQQQGAQPGGQPGADESDRRQRPGEIPQPGPGPGLQADRRTAAG